MDTTPSPAKPRVSKISSLSVATSAKRNGPTGGWDATDWRAYFDERAGIAEYDGGLPRADAEARAYDCCITEWLNQNPIGSTPGICLGCGAGVHQGSLVPFGLNPHLAWLHSTCWPSWQTERRTQAQAALALMGINPQSGARGGNE